MLYSLYLFFLYVLVLTFIFDQCLFFKCFMVVGNSVGWWNVMQEKIDMYKVKLTNSNGMMKKCIE